MAYWCAPPDRLKKKARKTGWWREEKLFAPHVMRKYTIYPYMIVPLAPTPHPPNTHKHTHTSLEESSACPWTPHEWNLCINEWFSFKCVEKDIDFIPKAQYAFAMPTLRYLTQMHCWCFEPAGFFFKFLYCPPKIKFFWLLQYTWCVTDALLCLTNRAGAVKGPFRHSNTLMPVLISGGNCFIQYPLLPPPFLSFSCRTVKTPQSTRVIQLHWIESDLLKLHQVICGAHIWNKPADSQLTKSLSPDRNKRLWRQSFSFSNTFSLPLTRLQSFMCLFWSLQPHFGLNA